MNPDDEARAQVDAAIVAIRAVIQAQPQMDVGGLVAGLVAVSLPGITEEARVLLARRITISLIQVVGASRAHEVIDEAQSVAGFVGRWPRQVPEEDRRAPSPRGRGQRTPRRR